MDLGRALQQQDERSRGLKRRSRPVVRRPRQAMWTRIAVMVSLSAIMAVLVGSADIGDGLRPSFGILAALIAIPFLWTGPPRIVDPLLPMTFTSQTHELVRLNGQVERTLVTRDGPSTTGTIGRDGAVAVTAIGLSLYVIAVALLLTS